MKIKGPLIAIGVIFIVGFILFGSLLFLTSQKKLRAPEATNNREPLGSREEALKRYAELPQLSNSEAQKEIIAAIIEAKDLEKCQVAEGVLIDGQDYGVVCKNNVAEKLAKENLDINYCRQLDGVLVSQKLCMEDILIALANKDSNEARCKESQDSEVEINCLVAFWSDQAKEKNDPQLCSKISDQIFKENCRIYFYTNQLISNSPVVNCSAVPEVMTADCHLIKSSNAGLKNKEICPKLTIPQLRDFCQNTPS